MDELLRLPGVGRKTANCVLGAAFDVPGVVVDTHVKRLAFRLGLTANSDPDKIEEDVGKLLPKERWRRFSDLLIYHGREVCKARKPEHSRCAVFDLCPPIPFSVYTNSPSRSNSATQRCDLKASPPAWEPCRSMRLAIFPREEVRQECSRYATPSCVSRR